jgi:signal transduction histidine kinase
MNISPPDHPGTDRYFDGSYESSSGVITPDEQIRRLYEIGRNQQELMASLLQGSKIILEYSDFNVSGRMLFEKCRSMTHSSCGAISLIGNEFPEIGRYQGESKCYDFFSSISHSPVISQMRASSNDWKCSVLDNQYRNPVTLDLHSENEVPVWNLLIVPLIHAQQVIGYLILGNKPEDFTETDVAVAEAFAELIALAWFNEKNLEELKIARRKAEESDRLKSAFLSNMSHEIRTPLNGILGFSELLAEPELDSLEREQYIRIMNQNGEQLMSIINNILDISLIESGQIKLASEWIDIKGIINDVYELFMSPGLRKKNVHYLLDCDSPGEIMVYTDPGRLRQILINLFGNATKFTQSGHVMLGCRMLQTENGREVAVMVEDTGIGIAPEKLAAIFERFRQAENTTKRRFGGTGLGLAISKGLTELLGGRIEVTSKPQEGSTFKVIFPVKEPA